MKIIARAFFCLYSFDEQQSEGVAMDIHIAIVGVVGVWSKMVDFLRTFVVYMGLWFDLLFTYGDD